MSANILRSSEDLDQFLNRHESAAVIAVRTGAARDITSPAVALARRATAGHARAPATAPDEPCAVRWRGAFARKGLYGADVLSVREAALALIDGAGEAFPRGARLLDGNETDVLMEDLKVSGLKPRRLREMTKFFSKGIADGESRDTDWLISAEEQQIWGILTENLKARRALLPVEASALALEALQTPGGAARARKLVPADALLIVPAFNTSRRHRSQKLARALGPATFSPSVPTSTRATSRRSTRHPSGFAQLMGEAGDDAADRVWPSSEETLACAHPAEEFDEVARIVAGPWMRAPISRRHHRGLPIACGWRASPPPRGARHVPALSTRGPESQGRPALKPAADRRARAPPPSSSPTSAISPPGAAGWVWATGLCAPTRSASFCPTPASGP